MSRIVKLESISQLHEGLGYEKPKHPLITIIDYTKVNSALFHEDIQVISSFYSITFKEGHECEVKYGRQYYDFQEGSLMFLAPGQSIIVVGSNSTLSFPKCNSFVNKKTPFNF